MAHQPDDKTGELSVPRFTFLCATGSTPFYRDAGLLRHKYIDSGQSAAKIAEDFGCARSTVTEALKRENIVAPKRPQVQTVPGRGLPFGFGVAGGRLVADKQEGAAISKIKELRSRGLSYWRVAAELDRLGIPTKTRQAGWKAATVMGIAKRWL